MRIFKGAVFALSFVIFFPCAASRSFFSAVFLLGRGFFLGLSRSCFSRAFFRRGFFYMPFFAEAFPLHPLAGDSSCDTLEIAFFPGSFGGAFPVHSFAGFFLRALLRRLIPCALWQGLFPLALPQGVFQPFLCMVFYRAFYHSVFFRAVFRRSFYRILFRGGFPCAPLRMLFPRSFGGVSLSRGPSWWLSSGPIQRGIFQCVFLLGFLPCDLSRRPFLSALWQVVFLREPWQRLFPCAFPHEFFSVHFFAVAFPVRFFAKAFSARALAGASSVSLSWPFPCALFRGLFLPTFPLGLLPWALWRSSFSALDRGGFTMGPLAGVSSISTIAFMFSARPPAFAYASSVCFPKGVLFARFRINFFVRSFAAAFSVGSFTGTFSARMIRWLSPWVFLQVFSP